MENQTSTMSHEEHKKDPYNTLKATKQFNSAKTEYESQEAELGRQRTTLGASIHSLETELAKTKSAYTKAHMETILSEKRKQIKEVEVNLDAVISERGSLSLTDYMGEGSRIPKQQSSDLRRSAMSDEDKVAFIAKYSMAEYMKLQY